MRLRTYRLGTEESGGDYGRVSTCAWIWQERLLSARTVFFTQHALKFECRNHSVWEGFARGIVGHSWPKQLERIAADQNPNGLWLRLVVEFMKRVMRYISKRTGWTPFWGVFEEAIVESLCWSSQSKKTISGNHAARVNPRCLALSHGSLHQVAPLVRDIKCQDLDRENGSILLVAKYVIGGVQCTVEPNESYSEREDHGERYKYKYKVRLSGNHPDFGFSPDVALMPSGGDGRPYTPSVIRVPHATPVDRAL
ncbi:hypothetical protein OQA88_5407 [Cercophora sp. LCS_1]